MTAEEVVRQCDQMGYAGRIWPVHPSKGELDGADDLHGVMASSYVAPIQFANGRISQRSPATAGSALGRMRIRAVPQP